MANFRTEEEVRKEIGWREVEILKLEKYLRDYPKCSDIIFVKSNIFKLKSEVFWCKWFLNEK